MRFILNWYFVGLVTLKRQDSTMFLISFKKLCVNVALFEVTRAETLPFSAMSITTVIEPVCFLMATFLL